MFAPTPEALILPPARPRSEAGPPAPGDLAGKTPAGWLETNAGDAVDAVDAGAKAPKRIETRIFAAFLGFAAVAATVGALSIYGGPGVNLAETPPAPFASPMPVVSKAPIASPVAVPAPVTTPVTIPALTETITVSPPPVSVADAIEETAPRSIAEILGYGWVLKTRCEAIPRVTWWKFNSHESIAGYVQRRHGGDWTPYLEKWLLRLAKLQDIHDRNSSAITNSGVVLRGEALADYIGQMGERLTVTRCLAGEARLAGNPSANSSS